MYKRSPARRRILRFVGIKTSGYCLGIIFVAIIGTILLQSSHAATQVASTESESGTVSAPAVSVTDTTASAGRAIQFQAPAPPSGNTDKPDATNTGVPAGTTLTTVTGNLTISADNSVVSGKHVTGTVFITGDNVTFENSQVDGNGSSGVAFAIKVMGSGDIVKYNTVAVPNKQSGLDGISVGFSGGDTAIVDHNNISGSTDGIKLYNSATISYNYIHDLTQWASDPVGQGGGASHNDGIQMLAGSNVTIAHNTDKPQKAVNSAIQVTQDSGSVSNLHIDGNWFDGGGCTVNLASNNKAIGPIYLTNNRFGRNLQYAGCPVVTYAPVALTQNSNNVWDDTGQTIPITQK